MDGGIGGLTTPGMSNGPPANTTQKCASQKPTHMPTPTATTAKAIAILRLTRQAHRYPSEG
jgi:hypothetical protein